MIRRREDFPPTRELPWLDRPDALEEIERRRRAGRITADQANWLAHFSREGYVVFENVLERSDIDAVNADVDRIVASSRHLPFPELQKKFENTFVHSAAIRRVFTNAGMLARLDLLFDRPALPYQTLNMPVSSQQAAHSDEILMTSHPPGYMAAVWFALEDITPDCGPLRLWPRSHRLPYIGARDVGIPRGVGEEECARVYNARYYEMIGEQIQRLGLQEWTFLPKCGDALIWHSNLLHGAHFVTRAEATRKSMIGHYYADGVVHYSDLFQRPCDLPGLRSTSPATR